MASTATESLGARLYVSSVSVAGAAVIIHSVVLAATHEIPLQWLLLAALTLFTGSFTVKLPSLSARLSVSEAFVFTAVLLFGTAAGTLTVALDALIISFRLRPRGKSATRVMFNAAAPAVSIWVASSSFYELVGNVRPWQLERFIVPLFVATLLYFLLNSWLIAIAIGLASKESSARIWRRNFLWLGVNYFGGASVAALIVAYTRDINATVLGVIVPLLVISYLTFRTTIGRLDDANRHVAQLNGLYISTVETLAMAIDAKDQITHGHIRRVQAYAVALAQEVGVTEPNHIRAIEAAALLHDTGKLAVPEYILNKPGRLTSAEFEKMKLHATVGADILSSIPFPYAVVPIVRHHHENWDGTGYPGSLAGSDIPIGARVLSVVDCFDALTSDRPYRPRLSNGEAFRILQERRGTMYDPLVVDAFKRIFPGIVVPSSSAIENVAIAELARLARDHTAQSRTEPLDAIVASTEEALFLYEFTERLAASPNLEEAASSACSIARRAVPAGLCILFLHEEGKGELVAHSGAGQGVDVAIGSRLRLGQGVSGWVGANRTASVNSDPVLDFGNAARSMHPRYRSSLSVPLINRGCLVGVLTLYSTKVEAYGDLDLQKMERIATPLAQGLTPFLAAGEIRPSNRFPRRLDSSKPRA